MKTVFLDTNIIMYSVGGSHPLRKPCRTCLEKIYEGKLSVITNAEVLQEILYRYISLNEKEKALQLTNSFIEICESVYPVTVDDVTLAMELIKKKKLPHIRDAIHAATMMQHDIKEILSTDKHFDKLPGIKRIDPRSLK
jgi:uncharacterized protein